jgi:DNA-binding NtrC family response regulator
VIRLPPLRERLDDLPHLVDHFLRQFNPQLGRSVHSLAAETWEVLRQHDWPGNVRELANLIERAVAMTDYDTITPDDLMMLRSEDGLARMLRDASARTLPLADLSRAYARSVVEAHGGNKAKAARALGIDRRTLYRML